MKKNYTDLMYRVMAGYGNGDILDQVSLLLQRRLDGQKLTKHEEFVITEAEKGLEGILGDRGKGGYCPEKAKLSESEAPPLPFSSFAEGLARLQKRIELRPEKSKVKGMNRPSVRSVPITDAKISAVVEMARAERLKLAKPSRKRSKTAKGSEI